ncbi:MAG TPA: type II toxin-antitoxin system VapC family toxin, partial [Candidatus Binatia bacterium]|nr:type II toxin-antitoxin system VapC family toxin [Candidatus Binatia bacterium]
AAAQRFESDDAVFLCVHVLGELRYGALASSCVAENLARLERFSTPIPVLPCDTETVTHYADIRFGLRKKGKPIPENDIWIAAIARQHGLRLLSRDSHFQQIENLDVETF